MNVLRSPGRQRGVNAWTLAGAMFVVAGVAGLGAALINPGGITINAVPVASTAINGSSASSPPAPSTGTTADRSTPDPALALSLARVDPSAATVTTGGFAGLKVGNTVHDARIFFGSEIVAQEHCGNTDPAWTVYSPKGLNGVTLASNTGRLVAFWLATNAYQTRSGLKVGDSESHLLELLGKDPTLERNTRYVESGAYHRVEYALGRRNPTAMRIFIKDGKVTDIIFGSSREIWNMAVPC